MLSEILLFRDYLAYQSPSSKTQTLNTHICKYSANGHADYINTRQTPLKHSPFLDRAAQGPTTLPPDTEGMCLLYGIKMQRSVLLWTIVQAQIRLQA